LEAFVTTDADVQGAEVIIMSEEEWQAAIQHDLDREGLTREDLAEMAKDDDFVSAEAKQLWWLIRDERPKEPRQADVQVRHDPARAA
jgi:hypothetical protein